MPNNLWKIIKKFTNKTSDNNNVNLKFNNQTIKKIANKLNPATLLRPFCLRNFFFHRLPITSFLPREVNLQVDIHIDGNLVSPVKHTKILGIFF